MSCTLPHAARGVLVALVLSGCTDSEPSGLTRPQAAANLTQNDERFGVWLVDQANSAGRTYAGTIHI